MEKEYNKKDIYKSNLSLSFFGALHFRALHFLLLELHIFFLLSSSTNCRKSATMSGINVEFCMFFIALIKKKENKKVKNNKKNLKNFTK
jgi:hypothetical protein